MISRRPAAYSSMIAALPLGATPRARLILTSGGFLGGITGVMVAGTKGPLIQIKTSWPQRDENGVSTRV